MGVLSNKLFRQVGALAIAAVIGALVWGLINQIMSSDSVQDAVNTVATGAFTNDSEFVGPVILTTGASITKCREGSNVSCREVESTTDKDILMPLTSVEAIAAGWEDPILCSAGRGRYFQKGEVGYGEPYFLMYNYLDQLIGIYYFSEAEMSPPWEYQEFLKGAGGLVIIDFEHWGLFTYFQDPTNACQPPSIEGSGGGNVVAVVVADTLAYGSNTVKSTPTPVLPPTPTPAADLVLKNAVEKTAKLKGLSFELTGDPMAKKIEGTLDRKGALTLVKEGVVTVTDKSRNTEVLDGSAVPFTFDSLGTTLSGIAAVLQDPVDAKSAYINNLKRRGVSGTVFGSDLTGLIPTAVADASVTVSLWFDERGRILRLQLEGAVIPEDAIDTVRVLDVGDF